MKNHVFGKAIRCGLMVSLLLTLFCIPALSQDCAAAEDELISITTKAPAVGEKIETKIDASVAGGGYTYVWSVNGKTVDCAGNCYTPSAADYESWIKVSLMDSSGHEAASDSIYFSPLPVVYIETDDPNVELTKWNYSDGSMFIQGNGLFDAQYEGDMQLKLRGASSEQYPKKPYKIKLDKKSNLFGFGKSKHYVLLANYLDPSLLRNTMAYRLADAAGLTSTESTWVDVVMNGKYAGNYQLCEKIRIGDQLIDIESWEDIASDEAKAIYKQNKSDFPNGSGELEDCMTENLSWITTGKVSFGGKEYAVSEKVNQNAGGYLFELDSGNKEFTSFTTNKGINVNVSDPEYIGTNSELLASVKEKLNDIEEALCSATGYNSKGQHYSELCDVDSMVSYWLVNEILSNEDAASRSRYCYFDAGGKLTFGPVWDFDISSQSFRSYMPSSGWSVTFSPAGWYESEDFWKEWVDDPYFQVKAREKYWELRPLLEDTVCEDGLIDQYEEYLYEAGVANETEWVVGREMMFRNFSGSNGDVEIYKTFLKERLEWLDGVFETENSTVSSLFGLLSSTPYLRSAAVKLSLQGAEKDTDAHGADYRISTNDTVTLTCKGIFGNTEIYINGLYYKTFSRNELKKGILISPELLTEAEGKANVISAVSTVLSAKCINHITVIRGIKTQSDIFYKEYPELTVCTEHSMTHVEGRMKTDSLYGIEDCWYCSKCQHYFADASGETKLRKKDIITPVNPNVYTDGYGIKILNGLIHVIRRDW